MKRVLLALLLLALILSAALGWLLTSENGLRWIYGQAESALDGALKVQQVSGSLGGGVTLEGVDFRNGNVQVKAGQMLLQWNPWALLMARIEITGTTIQQLDIELQVPGDANSAAAQAQPLELPPLSIPLALELHELSIDRLTLIQGDTPLILEQLRLQAAVRGSQVSISGLDLRLIDVAIDAGQRYDFDIHLQADIDTAADYAHEINIDWQTQLASGAIIDNSTRITGNLNATQLLQQTQGPLQLNLSLELGDLLNQLNWRASLDVTSFDTSLLAAELPLLNGRLELTANGDLSSARVSGRLDADSVDLGKLQVSFDLRSLDQARLADGLQVDAIELAIFDGKLAAQGQVYWSPMLSWNSDVTASDINPASLLPDWPGKLATSLHTEGQIKDGKITASARIAELSGMLRGYPLSLQSDLHWREDTLDIQSANLTSGDTRVNAHGKIGKTLDLDWSLDSRNLGELYPGAQGQLKASGHLSGEAASPMIAARFNGNSIRFIDYSVAAIDGDINIDPANWQQLDVRFAARQLEIQGQHLQSVEVNANQNQIRANIDADLVNTVFELAGKLDDQGWRGKLMTADIHSKDFSTWTLKAPVALSLVRDSISSEALCLESAQKAEICSAFQQRDESWDIRLDLARIPLGMAQQWIPAELQLNGVVNAGGELTYGPDGRLLGKLQAEFPAAAVTYPLQQGKPERFDYRLGELAIALEPARITVITRLELENGDYLEGELIMPQADILQLDIERQPIQAKLGSQVRNWTAIDAMIPQIESLNGELNLDVAISGKLAQPLVRIPAHGIETESGTNRRRPAKQRCRSHTVQHRCRRRRRRNQAAWRYPAG